MRMIKITEAKKEKLGMHVEKILSTAGKLMQCIEALDDPEEDDEDDDFGERRGSRMGMRGGMDDPGDMGERYGSYGNRRGRNGRYM